MKTMWTPEMVSRAAESMGSADWQSQLNRLHLSKDNNYKFRTVKDAKNHENLVVSGRLIKEQLSIQKQDLDAIKGGLGKSRGEMAELRLKIEEATAIMLSMESEQSAINYSIQRLKLDLSDLTLQREQLRSQVEFYQK